MGTNTPNYNLYKPDDEELVDIDLHLNANLDKIDTQFAALDSQFVAFSDSQTEFETEIQAVVASMSTVGTWNTYNPEFGNYSANTSGTAFILSNGTQYGEYYVNGKFCAFKAELVKGSTTVSGSRQLGFKLPLAAVSSRENFHGMLTQVHNDGDLWYRYPLSSYMEKNAPDARKQSFQYQSSAGTTNGNMLQYMPYLPSVDELTLVKNERIFISGFYRIL